MQNRAMRLLKIIAASTTPLLLASAAPSSQIISHPRYANEAVVVPTGSPVRFRDFDKDSGYARFDGSFVLTGKFIYGCGSNCADYEGPVEESDLLVAIEPDPRLVARLPHWKARQQDMLIFITGEQKLARAIATPRQHAALLAGKIPNLNGRIALLVDDFQTGLECDSATFTARFVSIAQAPEVARVELNGAYGCGL